jgi:glutathione peroxidase
MSIYDYQYTSIEGKQISLSDYRGKVLILVNTASKCGFTYQYEGLETLYKTYGKDGLAVIGFPCNQFSDQEPGTEEEIMSFCKLRFGVTFPLSAKIDVRGEEAHPLFRYLTDNTTFAGLGKGIKNKALQTMFKAKYGKDYADSSIKWNFTKFLIDRQGHIARRFEPTATPEEMEGAVKELLAQK